MQFIPCTRIQIIRILLFLKTTLINAIYSLVWELFLKTTKLLLYEFEYLWNKNFNVVETAFETKTLMLLNNLCPSPKKPSSWVPDLEAGGEE